ncbi:MAG: phosphotransferase family protein [Hyphomonadaceae bacterium]|nr:phosphotransferase family protein [Hyphomonadaceae bacterium]
MTPVERKYIYVFGRYLHGPIRRALEGDKHVSHIPVQMAAALSRLLAQAECADAHDAALRASAQHLLASLEGSPFECIEWKHVRERLHAILDTSEQGADELNALLAEAAALLGKQDDPGAGNLYADLVGRDVARLGELEAAYKRLADTPPLKSADLNTSALTGEQIARLLSELRTQCDEAADLEISGASAVVGGYSKLTILAKLERNKTLPNEIVIRFDRPESPTATTVATEYPLLMALHKLGARVPRPLHLDSEGRILGGPLMIVTREPGRVIADPHQFHDEGPNEALAASFAIELAKLHTIPLGDVPASVPGRERTNQELAIDDLQALREEWRATGSHSVTVEAAFRWLTDHVDQVGEQKCLLHGDARFHNILVSDGIVSSILDWELSSLGNPGSDLGYAYHHVVQLTPWGSFLAAYKSAGGPSVPDTTVKFFSLRTELFAVVKLAKLEAGFRSGAFENIDLIYAGTHVRQHNMYLLSRRLEGILRGAPL